MIIEEEIFRDARQGGEVEKKEKEKGEEKGGEKKREATTPAFWTVPPRLEVTGGRKGEREKGKGKKTGRYF